MRITPSLWMWCGYVEHTIASGTGELLKRRRAGSSVSAYGARKRGSLALRSLSVARSATAVRGIDQREGPGGREGNDMLDKSQKFGTVLTVGPRLKRLTNAGFGDSLLWEENYPDQEKPTADGRGEFQWTREWVETADLEDVFDLWCRGQNLIGFADTLLEACDVFKRICRKKKSA